MRKHGILGYGLLMILGLAWLVGQHGVRPLSADQPGGLPALEKRVAALETMVASLQQVNAGQAAEIASLKNRLTVVEAKTAPISVAGTDFVITGKNVFIQDGSGFTEGGTGLGNLTVGYNALRGKGVDVRTGTHNLILGDQNNYSSFGGLVAGNFNTISGQYATVSGGDNNTASGDCATVSGGHSNTTSGLNATVSGGAFNTAS